MNKKMDADQTAGRGKTINNRAKREIQHGEFLASEDTERAWGWGTPSGRARAKRRAEIIIAGARIGPESHVLEIGCGTGLFTEMFAETGCHIIGVDISGDLLEKARNRRKSKHRSFFLLRCFDQFCALRGPFDEIVGSSILHHLDLSVALPRIQRLLNPGGVMCFTEPNILNPQVFAERKLRRLFPHVSPDETAFNRWTLKADLKRAGFKGVEVTPFDWLHPTVPETLIGAVSAMGRLAERLPIVREFAGSLFIKAEKEGEA
jgi:2-polyprenyl-3-methyl-5-hydroxy-6-metoxy-1,4-benzoquinol methylase